MHTHNTHATATPVLAYQLKRRCAMLAAKSYFTTALCLVLVVAPLPRNNSARALSRLSNPDFNVYVAPPSYEGPDVRGTTEQARLCILNESSDAPLLAGFDANAIAFIDSNNTAVEHTWQTEISTVIDSTQDELRLALEQAGLSSSGWSIRVETGIAESGCSNLYLTFMTSNFQYQCNGADHTFSFGVLISASNNLIDAAINHNQIAQLRNNPLPMIMPRYVDPVPGSTYPDITEVPADELILPSGTPLRFRNSPYSTCRDELGPEPLPMPNADPCDAAIADFLNCVYTERCAALRSLDTANRKLVVSTAAAAGAGIAIAIAIACPPAAVVGLIGVIVGGGVAGTTAAGTLLDARAATEDAFAAMQNLRLCYDGIVNVYDPWTGIWLYGSFIDCY